MTVEQLAHWAAGTIVKGEKALLAVRDGDAAVVTLTLGEALGQSTRAGAVLARLLTRPAGNPWVVVAVRQGGPIQRLEKAAADRIRSASKLVDMPMSAVVLVRNGKVETLREGIDEQA